MSYVDVYAQDLDQSKYLETTYSEHSTKSGLSKRGEVAAAAGGSILDFPFSLHHRAPDRLDHRHTGGTARSSGGKKLSPNRPIAGGVG